MKLTAGCLVGVLVFALAGSARSAIKPFSLGGAPDGISDNAARTRDVGTLDDVIEYERLIDAQGITACDRYFGWNGQRPDPSAAQQILCGKYQFFYEHFGSIGAPVALVEFNHRWFSDFFGEEFTKLGFFADRHPRRLVSDVKRVAAGACLERQDTCVKRGIFGVCLRRETTCVRAAERETWSEVYTMGEDYLPVGVVSSPQRAYGLPSVVMTCAACHLAKLPDGRFAVGLANESLDYGMFIAGLLHTMQSALSAMGGPLTGFPPARLTGLLSSGQSELLHRLRPNPALAFDQPQPAGQGPPQRIEFKIGMCYRQGEQLEVVSCEKNHLLRGPEPARVEAAALLAKLRAGSDHIVVEDWPWPMSIMNGVGDCLPEPLRPGATRNQPPWAGFAMNVLPSQTLENIARACQGNRYNHLFWRDFEDLLMRMADQALLGGSDLPLLPPSDVDAFYRLRRGTLDFLHAPLSEDGVWTVSKIPPLTNYASKTETAQSPGMRLNDGRLTRLLGHAGSSDDLENYLRTFLLIVESVDPRYMRCATADIAGRWGATPDASCSPIDAAVAPLIAYITSLKAPHALAPETPRVEQGQHVFRQHCEGCHDGPSGQSQGVFTFSKTANEGLAAVPPCPPGQRSVEISPDGTPTFHDCHPAHRVDLMPRFIGYIATEPSYSEIFNFSAEKGAAAPELHSLGVPMSEGVRAPGLAGVGYRRNLLHHGGVDSLESLLCMSGTPRESAAQREAEACMYDDLDAPEAMADFMAGRPRCKKRWFPLRGHEMGCALDDDKKQALIEYLHTL